MGEGQWAGNGPFGEEFHDPAHLYATDLDLFGRGSLFERLGTVRTYAGERTLAAWLLGPAPVAAIHERHQALAELRGQIDFREELALVGEETRGARPERLLRWAEAPGAPPRSRDWLVARGLVALMLSGAALWAMAGFDQLFFVSAVALGGFGLRWRRQTLSTAAGAEEPCHDLELLAAVLRHFERGHWQAPRLRTLQAGLTDGGLPASAVISRLANLVERLAWCENPFFRAVSPLLLWRTQVAWAIEEWRAGHGGAVRRWLDSVGELDAMSALGAFALENPGYTLPEFVDGPTVFDAEEIGHPLLAAPAMVRNSVRLGTGRPLIVLSGSNMSGKSTLLRTIGVNSVLAMMGAPVCAVRLRLAPFGLGASFRVNDSLQEGASRFYAEIQRLKAIADAAARGPVLFLLDELLHGTNSQDRQAGGRGVVLGLLARGAVGIVTTHDLALTSLADAGGGINLHLEDRLEGGRLLFDYRLRDGVVRRSNALELMRSVGLDVGPA
ncbi:MAG: mismatch repair protein [Acidobacteria bacterium]|nr:mismatch repair protein [Acidobacteriota bacterium]